MFNETAARAYHDARLAESEEEARVHLDTLMEETGRAYDLVRREQVVGRRFNPNVIKWEPQLGDTVCYSIRSDCYYVGKVVKRTKTSFVAEKDGWKETFRWSKKNLAWCMTGTSYCRAFPGTEEDEYRDPHF